MTVKKILPTKCGVQCLEILEIAEDIPSVVEINALRSHYSFGMIPGEKRKFGNCDMEIEKRQAAALEKSPLSLTLH